MNPYSLTPDDELSAQIVEQNIAYHEATADLYDLSHPELEHLLQRRMLAADLKLIRELVGETTGGLALDVGAGTGRMTRRLVREGFDCLALDNSPAMLAVLRRRYERLPDPKGALLTAVAGATEFDPALLDGRAVQVVAFSSVLHHLPDYLATLDLYAGLLAPGGVLYITHEPLTIDAPRRTPAMKLVRAVDRLLVQPQQIAKTLKRLLGGRQQVKIAEPQLVDYHHQAGLDPEAITATLSRHGLQVVRLERYKDRKTALMAWLDTAVCKTPNWHFRLVAHKAGIEI